ncbi:MAG: hypothetical protein NC917_04880 [Candidatus Omnitrophica bacterium]|nr:hypothetical protein [Candidatus Omnitrophota bacterium]MCM8810964.1 hypothetical protein [Candidatus Omnitrophota bacterium]
MTSKERIKTVLRGGYPDRVPVSLYKINPFDNESFWAKHKSFENLLNKAREIQDTFLFYRPKTGFFFSAPGSIDLKIEETHDTPISTTVRLTVETEYGPLTRTARTSNLSIHQWVVEPWIKREKDIHKFLSLPYIPYQPDFSDFYEQEKKLGEKGIMVVALPDPLGVVGFLFAPGDFGKFALDYPKLVMQLLEKIYERLLDLYKFVSFSISNAIIRIRGAEYATPPNLPTEYFHDIKKTFSEFVFRFDKTLIEILKRGNFNWISYHWHDGIEELLPIVLKMPIDIIEPISNSFQQPNNILKVRRIVGDSITIMGGILAEEFDFKTREEIRNMVKDCLIQGARGGRFILIPSDIPESAPIPTELEQNYIEFLESGLNFGKYPIR